MKRSYQNSQRWDPVGPGTYVHRGGLALTLNAYVACVTSGRDVSVQRLQQSHRKSAIWGSEGDEYARIAVCWLASWVL